MPDSWQTDRGVPLMGAEDFSYYLQHRPGAFALIGTGQSPDGDPPLHSPEFDFNDRIIPLVVRAWSAIVGLPITDPMSNDAAAVASALETTS